MSLPTPFSQNGRVLRYHGEDVFLAGRYPNIGELPAANYDVVLRKLAVQRNNFFRHWIMAYWNYAQPGNAHSPFHRREDGKWNVTAYNPDYFARLDAMIRAAQHHGIVVQLTLFDVPGLKGGWDRWGNNPWNAANNSNGFITAPSGLPGFYAGSGPLRAAQQAFVEKVVGATMKYWNVFYEIINEGGGSGSDVARREERARWFDAVAGWIHGKTGGGRLIFHNDHSEGAQEANDVKVWKRLNLQNYVHLSGVILHFDPLRVNPGDARYDELDDKIFQVSTDAFDDPATPDDDREMFEWNAAAMPVFHARKVIYQAEASCPDVGRAIGQAAPPPTDLRLGRFTHVYRGTLGQAQIQRRFFMDAGLGHYIDYGAAGEVGRGRVDGYAFVDQEQHIRLTDVRTGTAAWWRYTFTGAGGGTLTLVNLEPGAAATLTLQRVARAPLNSLIPLLYNWERVEATGSPVAEHFELRFDADGAMRAFRRNPYEEMDHHDVRAVDPVAKTITLVRLLNGASVTYRYSFEPLRSGVRRLRLVNQANNANLLFEERAWYIPPMMAAATPGVPTIASAAGQPALV
ncbi:MAG TPA: hypothetical protein VFJ16_32395 [Longimicrobium sp.]|nr:hypothetical protein [Longimicrobium sp.]